MVAALTLDLTAQWHDHPGAIDASQWDRLVAGIPGGTPFMRHSFLSAMVDSGSACAKTGWQPLFVTLHDGAGQMVAACATFAKSHSYGEYVFDWAWADAHDRAFGAAGASYFPKLLGAVPFSPVPGPRLLVDPNAAPEVQQALRKSLLHAISQQVQQQAWSSAHILFVSDQEAGAAKEQGWLERHGVQFHWQNRQGEPYFDYEDFLASLHRDKRKKIHQERRKVRDAGVSFEVLEGAQILDADWDFFHRCYTQTYLQHGQQPYLSREFWRLASESRPQDWVLFVASREGERMACALLAVDTELGLAYGRYWGALSTVSCLHFEACYYQPMAWCIAKGYQRFEGGAQGEHKLARGLLGTPTQSVHWLAHPGFKQAVADFLHREGCQIQHYIDELDDRKPFKPLDALD
ncbi:GNAT family N-acetyltransferase [Aquabacterium sp.]|uniref:GNAT family N-acetyltransferase n=1 Tax=Aquabacterium sp. TaxID=1872578 RepID=UPI002489A39E|nr:GNAT family N-acetyltransferase [Aquabacterium sp.]MDI1260747.1 GNAT family N-acetyltransferase [Aquabacterium sp.]